MGKVICKDEKAGTDNWKSEVSVQQHPNAKNIKIKMFQPPLTLASGCKEEETKEGHMAINDSSSQTVSGLPAMSSHCPAFSEHRRPNIFPLLL